MKDIAKIKLFVDAHCFDKEHQGTRAFIKRLYIELSKESPNIEFYFGAKNIEALKREFKDMAGCKFIRYRSANAIVRLLIEIPLIVYRYRIHIAHFQYIIPFIKNCKCIVTTHDVLFNDFRHEFSTFYRVSRNFLFRYSIKNADIVTTVSEYSKSAIQRHFKVDPLRILVTSNGVNQEFFQVFDKELSRKYIKENFNLSKYILYVSRFEPRKNHVLLLKAFLELKLYLQDYHLVLLGYESISTPEFNNVIRNLPQNILRFIFISDKVNDEDLFHFYRGTELFVFPSKAEGFGLPPIEAAALKMPVICSNSTAMSDYTFFGKYHVDPDDYGQFVSKINEIIKHPPEEADLNRISAEIAKRYVFKQSAQDLYKAILTEASKNLVSLELQLNKTNA